MSILKKASGLVLLLGAGTFIAFSLRKPKVLQDLLQKKDEPIPVGGQGFLWPDGTKRVEPFVPKQDSAKLENPSQPVYLPTAPPNPIVSVFQPLPPEVSFINTGVAINHNANNNAMSGFTFYN